MNKLLCDRLDEGSKKMGFSVERYESVFKTIVLVYILSKFGQHFNSINIYECRVFG